MGRPGKRDAPGFGTTRQGENKKDRHRCSCKLGGRDQGKGKIKRGTKGPASKEEGKGLEIGKLLVFWRASVFLKRGQKDYEKKIQKRGEGVFQVKKGLFWERQRVKGEHLWKDIA